MAGYDNDRNQAEEPKKISGGRKIRASEEIPSFAEMLHQPHAIMIFIPAVIPADSVIKDPLPFLGTGGAYINQRVKDKLVEHKHYISK